MMIPMQPLENLLLGGNSRQLGRLPVLLLRRFGHQVFNPFASTYSQNQAWQALAISIRHRVMSPPFVIH